MTAVSLLRLTTVAGALSAAVTSAVPAASAQPFRGQQLITGAIGHEPTAASGYMALGGGLARAMETDSDRTDLTAPVRKLRKAKAPSRRDRPAVRETVASLVADTLDPTGLNIARIGLERP
jgi:hypothetical protein